MPKYFKIGVLLLGLLSSQLVLAKREYVIGEGKFYANDGDSLAFVKSQLLHSAYKDIINREMKSMGLNGEMFWQKYQVQFDKYFTPIEEGLQKKYSKGDEVPTGKNKTEFKKALRLKKMRLMSRYGKISQVISTYSITNISRSPRNPKVRYIKLRAQVNRPLLRQVYSGFLRSDQERNYSYFFISTDFELKGITWENIGVEVEQDFSKAVRQHWKKWVNSNIKTFSDKVILATSEQETELRKYVGLPLESINNFLFENAKVEGEDAEESEKSAEEVESDSPNWSSFKDAIWLQVHMIIKGKEENKLLRKQQFTIEGDTIVLDLNTRKIIDYQDIEGHSSQFTTKDKRVLSSNLATMVYRSPLRQWTRFSEKLSSVPGHLKRVVLDVKDIGNIGELLEFQELLEARGISGQFRPEVESYTGEIAQIGLKFSGEYEKMVLLINSLDNSVLNSGKVVSIPKKDEPFDIIFLPSENIPGALKSNIEAP